MKFLCAFLLLLSLSHRGNCQYDPEKVNRKATRLYQEAIEKGRYGEFEEGIRKLKEALRIDPRFADAFLSIAGMYSEEKEYDSAILYYEKARDIDSSYFRDYELPYSINLAGKGEFAKALTAIDDFLKIPNLNERSIKAVEFRKKCYQFALDYARNKPQGNYAFEPRNMGDSINSTASEYFPSISLDGKELVFTRRVGGVNEDFFSSHLLPNGQWSKAAGLEGNINSAQNEGALTLSQDGQWLIFTGCNWPDGIGSCDLYISYLTDQGWSRPENLGYGVNTEAWESAPSLSPDKRDLYFSSTRSGGYGGSDLYVCHRLPNGHWSKPENLGPEINTAGDESSPFIHADNQTLYFTSNGHIGYGDFDLFLTRKGKGGRWSKPENLGYPINTIESEGSLIVAADGKTAYYASDRKDSRGGMDLYTFELRQDIRPARTSWISGRVYDAKTGQGLPSAVELTDLDSGELLSRVQTDPSGHYLITLPTGKDYAFNVERKGYLFYSENYSLREKSPDSTYHLDIPLQPLETNATVVLKNIFFPSNEYSLQPESATELDKLVQLMKDNPGLRVEISGYTDNIGSAKDNQTLSENRARSVVEYLVSKGIDAGRLQSKGYGASRPVAPNDTEEGRARNRRTELRVLSH